MKVLPKGTVITCPQCAEVMCVVKVELKSGDLIKSENFASVQADIKPGHKMLELMQLLVERYLWVLLNSTIAIR